MTNENDLIQIPYCAHESDMERLERTNKRLWIVVLVLILALIGTNGFWIYYENQFEEVVTETTQKLEVDNSDGGNAIGFIGNDNEVNYGESESNENN